MSRWNRRTQEEKERIKKEQEELHKPKEQRLQEKLHDDMNHILEQKELPLRCKKCGMTTSKHYTLAMMKNPLTGEPTQTAFGKCIKCGSTARKVVEVGVLGLDLGMVVAQIFMFLKSQGRLTDDRKGEVREWR